MAKWVEALYKFLDTQDMELVFDISHIKTIVAHTLVYQGDSVPSEGEINKVIWEYQDRYFGDTTIAEYSSSHVGEDRGTYTYVGSVLAASDRVRHGFGVYRQNDGLRYEGYFKNGVYHGYGYGEMRPNSIECGLWEEGRLVKRLHPKHVVIQEIRSKAEKLLQERKKANSVSNNGRAVRPSTAFPVRPSEVPVKLVLIRDRQFGGFVGEPTGAFTANGKEVCVGDTIAVDANPGRHSAFEGVVAVFGDHYGVMGLADSPLGSLPIMSIVRPWEELKAKDLVGVSSAFVVKAWRGSN